MTDRQPGYLRKSERPTHVIGLKREERHMPDGPKYPEVQVQLVGEDGNAFTILGAVSQALRRAGYGDEVRAFTDEASSGDYDHLLQTCMAWVTVS